MAQENYPLSVRADDHRSEQVHRAKHRSALSCADGKPSSIVKIVYTVAFQHVHFLNQ